MLAGHSPLLLGIPRDRWQEEARLKISGPIDSGEKTDASALTPEPSETPTSSPFSKFSRFASPYLRLARLHTIMAWAVFPAPAVYTTILFYATQLPDIGPKEKTISCLQTCVALFFCVMSYRAAGLAWDDVLDREYDEKVTRSKGRPLPARELTVEGALLWICTLAGFTACLVIALMTLEVFLGFLMSSALFVIYPLLKRHTHYTQLFGAFLISMGVIQAWLACAAVHNPVKDAGSGWMHVAAIMYRDVDKFGPIFLMEYLFEVAHELIYGCQDTEEDIYLGLCSLSIMCGYESSRKLGFLLVCGFATLVGYCAFSAGLPGWPLPVVPAIWLIINFSGLDLAVPTSCGAWASIAIKVKVLVTLSFAIIFAAKEFNWSIPGLTFLS